MQETVRHTAITRGKMPERAGNFTAERAGRVLGCHRSFPEYTRTPLARLDALARELGVSSIRVKDESFRFGLNAFKVLGSGYAICRLLADRLGLGEDGARFPLLTSPEAMEKLGKLTFATATDGNHGRGMAWAAARLGHRAVVRMPKGSVQERLDNIRRCGADAEITDLVYDDVVRQVSQQAAQNGWIVVQDTSAKESDPIPEHIMQGYLTMALEAWQQLEGNEPTHIFLQAGVGSMAASVAAFFANTCVKTPRIVIVEPFSADCVFRTAQAADGKLHAAPGPMKTIMAGLACGEVCRPAWDLLCACASDCVAISDSAAADAMRVLGAPLPGDDRVISGESGASGFGAALEILGKEENSRLRKELGLDASSRILCFSTEGATDRENYRKIVWNGACSS